MPIQLSSSLPISAVSTDWFESPDYSAREHLSCLILSDAPVNEQERESHRKALQMFEEMLAQSPRLRDVLDVCVMSAGVSPNLELDFVPGSEFQVPSLTESPQRNLNIALELALTKLEYQREKNYAFGNCFSMTLLFLISGGHTCDQAFEEAVRNRLRDSIVHHGLGFIPMMLGDADADYLASYYPRYIPGENLEAPSVSNFRDAMPTLHELCRIPPKPRCISLPL